MKQPPPRVPPPFLGIEGGATHTTMVLLDSRERVLARVQGGPCNLRLLNDGEILRLWRSLASRMPRQHPAAAGAFLAGCRTRADEARVRRLLKAIWPGASYAVGNDMQSALAAAFGAGDGIILICGTGSAIRARRGRREVHVGGWGHVGGDGGSGYWMGRVLVRTSFESYDRTGSTDSLTQATLAFLGLNVVEELVQWSLEAHKDEMASLTRVLFRHRGHPQARRIIREAAGLLADEVVLAARKAGFSRRDAPEVALNPGLAKHEPHFRAVLTSAIRRRLPGVHVFVCETDGAIGAARLASVAAGVVGQAALLAPPPGMRGGPFRPAEGKQGRLPYGSEGAGGDQEVKSRGLAVALTEQRNPRTMDMDRRSIPQMVRTMLDEESRTIPAIRTQAAAISRVIGWIVGAMRRGGRLFYMGAGTSGRVGVLDASECPPTFGCDPGMVQGIMAGGWRALYMSMESCEDDGEYGRQTVRDRGVRRGDVLVGIAASGSTPFVLGGLEEANRRGAKTVLLTFNPESSFILHPSRLAKASGVARASFIRLAIPTGPEVVTGSTRLKAGTATKLVLNMFTTIAMIRLGKVKGNLMVDLDPSCEKLHDRAARIYSALKKVSHDEAWARLEKAGWNLKKLLGR